MNNKRKKIWKGSLSENISLTLLSLPAFILVFLFNYLPMFGVVMAFQDYKYPTGFLGSRWVGLQNFKFIFSSNEIYSIIGNTVGYHLVFHIAGTIMAILVAIFLYEINSKRALKIYQTSILLPSFISFVLVAYIVFTLLSNEYGIVNKVLTSVGLDAINWYNEPKYWPAVMVITHLWKGTGYSCILYYASIMGIDPSLFEAAKMDGANKWKQIKHIIIPSIVPIISVLTIMSMGSIMSGNFDMFFQVPRQSSALFSTTDIINTYVYRGLRNGNLSVSSAVGFFQSFIGAITLLVTNAFIRKISPDDAMF